MQKSQCVDTEILSAKNHFIFRFRSGVQVGIYSETAFYSVRSERNLVDGRVFLRVYYRSSLNFIERKSTQKKNFV